MSRYAEIAFPLAVRQAFTYEIPGDLGARLAIGSRVLASFRGRPRAGYCVGLSDSTTLSRVLPLSKVLDPDPMLPDRILALCRWIAKRTRAPLGEAIQAALPAPVRRGSEARTILWTRLRIPASEAVEKAASLSRAPSQASILRTLAEAGGELPVADLSRPRPSPAALESLERRGWIEVRRIHPEAPALPEAEDGELGPFPLTPDQTGPAERLTRAVRDGEAARFLLQGVTGSGKTEVYLRAIEECLRIGKAAIVLLPEVSLTPQTERIFRTRFGEAAVLHSYLPDGERAAAWRSIAAGRARVVVGARSAVFAPSPRVGLLVVDEEQESAFKQESSPRYHARDAAVERARIEGAPVVLCSATPSLETYQAAKTGEFERFYLPRRVRDLPMPNVVITDLRHERAAPHGGVPVGPVLYEMLRQTLDRKEQAILLLNRRGFSRYVACMRCGHTLKCPHCALTLTVHKLRGTAMCHLCLHEVPAPVACPECRAPGIQFLAPGTERALETIRKILPGARVARLDSDAAPSRGPMTRILSDVWKGNVDVLIGTQMVAKGLDVPNVTLVGVLLADVGLHMPDFRASERVFHLLSQVVGRAGRREKPGRAVIQTFLPDHPSIRRGADHDFEGFADDELAIRKELGYPPFRRLLRVLSEAVREEAAEGRARAAANAIRPVLKEGEDLLGPAPCPIPMARGKQRWHLLVKAGDDGIDRALDALEAAPGGLRDIVVDRDPVGML
ncbi:MAG: primosomal protein N' [Planctomycetota bacterium]